MRHVAAILILVVGVLAMTAAGSPQQIGVDIDLHDGSRVFGRVPADGHIPLVYQDQTVKLPWSNIRSARMSSGRDHGQYRFEQYNGDVIKCAHHDDAVRIVLRLKHFVRPHAAVTLSQSAGVLLITSMVRTDITAIEDTVRGRDVGVLTNGTVWLDDAGNDLDLVLLGLPAGKHVLARDVSSSEKVV